MIRPFHYLRHLLLPAVACGSLFVATASFANPGITTEVLERPYKLAELNEKGIPSVLAGVQTQEQWQKKHDEIKEVWLDYMGGIPERPPVKFEIIEETQMPDHLRQKIVYNTAYGDTITAYLLIPNAILEAEKDALQSGKAPTKRYPAILALHPTNAQGKDSVATPEGRKNRTYGIELAQRGYIVLAPDNMTSGERIFPNLSHFNSTPFEAQHPEWSTVGKNLVDHLQSMDLLEQHPLVDGEHIGVIGHSFGAYNAYFLASVDDRVKVLVSSCGVSPFTGAPEKIADHWGKRRMPYIHFPRYTEDMKKGVVPFEFNEIMALAAPTPQFYFAAQGDRIFPHWEYIGQTFVDLRALYAFLGKPENFVSFIGEGEHDFPPAVRQMAYEYLDGYLREQ